MDFDMVRLVHWVRGPRHIFARRNRPQRRRCQPVVEALEDRVTPSTYLERVADYHDDFATTGTLKPGWQYLWNQPDNWVAGTGTGGATGNASTGSIGNTASFRPLVFIGSGKWTPDGNTDYTHLPDGYLQLFQTGGHPGLGTSYPAGNLERFAIAAYTVGSSGPYELDNATLGRPSTVTGPGIDGDEILVFVNNTGSSPLLRRTVPTGGGSIPFNTSLGLLNAGDTVYVAVGALDSDTSDAFTLEFTLNRVAPRELPLRSLDTTGRVVTVAAPSGGDDAPAIRAAIAQTRQKQQTTPGPWEVRLQAGATYHVGTAFNQYYPYAFYVNNADNLVFNGNGANVLVTDPTLGVFDIVGSRNVIVQNLASVDYENMVNGVNQALPFTQGTITAVNTTTNQVTLQVDAGYPAPTASQFQNAPAKAAIPIDPANPGRLVAGTPDGFQYSTVTDLGSNQYEVQLNDTTGLAVNTRLVVSARGYSNIVTVQPGLPAFDGAFTTYTPGHQVSIINTTVYTSPNTFVVSWRTEAVNVLHCQIQIKPGSGRLLTTDADAVWPENNRVGPWVENCSFTAMGDDDVNPHSTAFTVTAASADNETFTLGNWDTRYVLFHVGDHLTFFNQTTGGLLGRVTVTAVSGAMVTVDTAVSGVVFAAVGTADDKTSTKIFNDDLSQGYVIRGNTFTNNRSRGVVLKGSNGQVVDNAFVGQGLQAILMANEPYFNEGLIAENVLIQHNTFDTIGLSRYYPNSDQNAAVVVQLSKWNGSSAVVAGVPFYAFSGLTIRSNTFLNWSMNALLVRNTTNVSIGLNTFGAPRVSSTTGDNAIVLSYVGGPYNGQSGVTISANTVDGTWLTDNAKDYFLNLRAPSSVLNLIDTDSYKTPSTFLEPVADYHDDFAATGTLKPGWQYLWNAPDNWVTGTGVGGATGNVSSGSVGNTASFKPLVFAGTGQWTPDGNTDYTHLPDGYLQLTQPGGHPGLGTSYPASNLERFAIAAYTVSSSGAYELDNATLSRPSTVTGPGIDGDEVLVFVNNTGNKPLLRQTVPTGGGSAPFNTSLGLLNAGDTVYVAVGALTSDSYDGFGLEFTLNRLFTPGVVASGVSYFKVSVPSGPELTGTSFPVTVTAVDASGNTFPSYAGEVHFTSSDANAVLPADATLTNGVGTFNVTLKSTGNQTITVSDVASLTTPPLITGSTAAIETRGLTVTGFTPTATGFTVTFSKPIVNADITLYGGTQATPIQNVQLVGKSTLATLGAVNGIFVIDPSGVSATFKASTDWLQNIAGQTDGLLPNDTWTVTLESGAGSGATANGFFDALGAALDGAGNGGHANYTTTFVTSNDGKPALTIPDFARGPDGSSTITMPNNSAKGILVTLAASPAGTKHVVFTLHYNPDLFTPTGAGTGDSSGTGSTFTMGTPASGAVTFTWHNDTGLGGSDIVLGDILANVPNAAVNQYRAKELLTIDAITINGAAFTGATSPAVHVNAYFGDLSGNGQITGLDLANASNIAAGLPTSPIGLSAYKLVDPGLIGDIGSDGSIDSAAISSLAGLVAHVATPPVPTPPSGLIIAPGGPDPVLSLGSGQWRAASSEINPSLTTRSSSLATFTLPVLLDHARPDGSTGMTEAIIGLVYDPRALTVSAADITLGSLPAAGSGWRLDSVVDAGTGQIAIDLYSTTALTEAQTGSLVNVVFHSVSGAYMPATAVQLVSAVSPQGHWYATEVTDAESKFVLSPGVDRLLRRMTALSKSWLNTENKKCRGGSTPRH
jgi:hypothetical protein